MKNQFKRAWLLAILLVPVMLLSFAFDAGASHFRYGTLSWSKTSTNGTVMFSFKAAFRRTSYTGTAPDGRPKVGDIITETVGLTGLNFGDGTPATGTLRFVVTSFSTTEDWILGEALEPNTNNVGVPHAYAGAGPYMAAVAGSARVSNLNNGANGSYRMESNVTPFNGNSSPVTSQPPIVTLPASTAASFTITGSDPNGDNVRYRIATSTESGVLPPAGLAIDQFTGVITWNTSALNQTNPWTVQIMIIDVDANGFVKTKTPIDFLLKIVPVVGIAPSVAINQSSPISVCNSPVNFTVTATDPDAGATVTLSAAGMPSGAVMSPLLPASGSSGLSSNFSWTPTASQTGSFVVAFTVTDNTGQQTQKSMVINVSSPTATVAGKTICAGQSATLTAATNANNASYLWNPGGATTQSITVSPANTTNYTVTVFDGVLACSTSATGTVTVNPLPNVVATSNSPVNPGATITAFATGATNYTWSGPDNYIAAGPGFSINNAQASHAGSYTVEGTDGNGCKNTASTTVSINPPAGALNFDGVNDYVRIANPYNSFGKELTIEWTAIIDPSSAMGSGISQSTEGVDGPSSLQWMMHYLPGANPVIQFYIGDNGVWKHADAPVTAGWHKYTGVAGPNGIKIYKDGVLAATSPDVVTGNIVNATNSVITLGKDSRWFNQRYMKGQIDEVRIWNRALCEGEIDNNLSCELSLPQNGLVEYYQFNQGFIGGNNAGETTLTDLSGNNKHGDLQNLFALNGATSNWVAGNASGACATFVVPVATITPAGPTTVCGGSVILNASTGAGYTYQWKLNGNNIANANGATHAATASGNYTVEVSASNCPVISSPVSVTINPVPVVAATNNGPVNQGSTLNVSATGATTYTWSGPNSYIAAGASFNISNVQPAAAGVYTVIGTHPSGCADTATTTVVVNVPAGALDFTGGSDYVDIGSVLPSNSSYTREGWFYSTDASSLNNLFSTNQDPVYIPGGFLNVGQGNNYGVLVDPQPFPLSQWTHVAITYDKPTNTLRLYINGALRASTTNAPAFVGGNTHLGHHSGGGGTSAVKMEEVRFWNRALCQAEITNNMNCGLSLPQTGLLAYYKFNQGFVNANNGSVTTLLDASGNNKNGTLVNFALTGGGSNWTAGNITGSCASFVPPVATITPAGTTTSCAPVVLNANTGTGYTYQWKLNGNDIPNATASTYTANATGNYSVVVAVPGCSATSSVANVTVNEQPAFTACPSNMTTNTTTTTCDAVVNYNTPVTGIPAPSVTYTLTGATTGSGAGNGSGLAFNKGVTTVTINADNSCGTAQCSFTVTVNDNVNPVVTANNITAYLNASGNATVTTADVNNGSSDNCGTLSLGLVGTTTTTGTICATGVEHGASAVLTAPAGATITAINFASYGLPNGSCGNFTTSSCHSASSMSVVSNLAIGQNSVSIPASNALFGDPCFGAGKRLYIQATYQLTVPANVPSLTFNCGKLGANTVTLVGKDATGNTSSATAVVTVLDTIKPVLTIPSNITVNCNGSIATAVTGNASATDNCGATVTFADASTQSASVNSAAHYNYTITRTWTAKDASNNSVSANQVITVQDITKPNINCPSAITVACDGDTSISTTGMATADDNCSPVMITRSDVSTQSANVNDNAHYNYTITRTWVAKDVTGNSNSCTQIITVEDAVAPTITNCPSTVTVNCQDATTPAALGSMTADDNCSPVAISHSDVSTQSASNTNAAHYNYTITRTWTATDVTGNSNSCTQVITVEDVTKPSISVPQNATVNCQDDNTPAANGNATGTDNCSSVAITYSDASTQNANPNNNGHYNYVITRTWTATDVTGNSTSADQSITVQDITKPGISVPQNVTLNCQDDNSTTANGTATGTDNCSPVAITFSDASTQNANPNNAGHYNYVITRTWTAADVTGNSTSADQTITVQDVTKPGISVPSNVTVNCQDDKSTGANGEATGTDNCSPVAITFSDASTQNVNPNNSGHYNYVITRTWTATDVTGNSTSADQTITVQDVTKPGITIPSNVTVNCQDDNTPAANGTATGTDNCSPVAITYSDASTKNANPNNAGHYNYVITRTWTATDVTGNSTSADQTITVQDITAPGITCPANTTVSCKTSVADNGSATGTDNCSPVAITHSDVSTQNSNPANSGYYNYTITRTWKATDVSGNFTTCDQVITVHALNNPAITVSPVNTINTKHQNHTIYLGYGPQSVTLASTVLDGVGNRNYSWTPITGCAAPGSATTSVSPLTTTTYTVTITDATGCSITKNETIQVIDVRCGNKIKICHYPPGNNGNPQQLCLPTSAIPAHLAHGCVLGDCPQSKNSEFGNEGEEGNHGVEAMVVTEVKVYPNPNTGAFTVELPAGLEQSEVVIMDMAGKVIQKQTALEGTKLQFDLGPVARGMYMLHLTNGSQNFRTRISVQ